MALLSHLFDQTLKQETVLLLLFSVSRIKWQRGICLNLSTFEVFCQVWTPNGNKLLIHIFEFNCGQSFKPSNVCLKYWLWPLASCRQVDNNFLGKLLKLIRTHELFAIKWVFFFLLSGDIWYGDTCRKKFWPCGGVSHVRRYLWQHSHHVTNTNRQQSNYLRSFEAFSLPLLHWAWKFPYYCLHHAIPSQNTQSFKYTSRVNKYTTNSMLCPLTHNHNTILCRY